MKIFKATSDDSYKLIQYFRNTFFPGSVGLEIHREKDFFAPYRIQSDDFVTYYLADEEGRIQATTTLIFKKGWVAGREQVVGYITDLRVSSQRKSILQWYQYFLPIINEEKDRRNCQIIFSVVPQRHLKAYNAFVRPRHNRRQLPRYYLVRQIRLVTLHGLAPFAPAPLSGLAIRTASQGDRLNLINYISNKKAHLPISFSQSQSDVSQYMNRWENLNTEDFILALDAKGEIVGCTALWRSTGIQEFYVRSYSPKVGTLRTIFNFFSCLGFTHRLPRVGEALEPVFLTHLFADNPDIFYSLLYYVFKKMAKSEFLVYYNFKGHLTTLPPKSFIHLSMPCGLYCVLPPDSPLPHLLRPRPFQEPLDFEPAFL